LTGGEKEKEKTPEITDPEQLSSLIDSLSPQQQKQLLDLLALKASTPDAGEARDLEMWSGAIYDALQKALGHAGGAMGGPLAVKRSCGAPSAWAPVRDFLNASGLAKLEVRHRLSTYRVIADLVVAHASRVSKRTGAPLSPRLVCNCMGSVAGIFNAAFPGYLEAGLACVVARQLATHGLTEAA
jgi:hypothetical protein